MNKTINKTYSRSASNSTSPAPNHHREKPTYKYKGGRRKRHISNKLSKGARPAMQLHELQIGKLTLYAQNSTKS